MLSRNLFDNQTTAWHGDTTLSFLITTIIRIHFVSYFLLSRLKPWGNKRAGESYSNNAIAGKRAKSTTGNRVQERLSSRVRSWKTVSNCWKITTLTKFCSYRNIRSFQLLGYAFCYFQKYRTFFGNTVDKWQIHTRRSQMELRPRCWKNRNTRHGIFPRKLTVGVCFTVVVAVLRF